VCVVDTDSPIQPLARLACLQPRRQRMQIGNDYTDSTKESTWVATGGYPYQ
jgi:hypothetical protein